MTCWVPGPRPGQGEAPDAKHVGNDRFPSKHIQPDTLLCVSREFDGTSSIFGPKRHRSGPNHNSKKCAMRLLVARRDAGVLPTPPTLLPALLPTLLPLLACEGTLNISALRLSRCPIAPTCAPPRVLPPPPAPSRLNSASSSDMSKAVGRALAVLAAMSSPGCVPGWIP